MKKFILSLVITLIIALPAFCVSFMPKYNDNIKNYGIGIYFGEGQVTVLDKPDENAKVIANVSWDKDKVTINDEILEPKNVFIVFLPSSGLSGFIATDEQDSQYTEIIYNNSKQLKGWIKNSEGNKAFSWRELFYQYGKSKGLYLFSNMPKDEKILKLSPEVEADTSYTFIYPKYIKLQLIKGNWALLKIVDYDNEQKVGWFKWRNADGSLNIFPQFSE